MADGFSVTVEVAALISAMTRFPDNMAKHLKAAAKVTADRIVSEAKGRVARRTGETAAGIHAEETTNGDGYVVLPSVRLHQISGHTMKRSGRFHTQRVTQRNVAIYLEFGTKHMTARPFFFNSARLEQGPHDRRIAQAIQDAVDESGLGE